MTRYDTSHAIQEQNEGWNNNRERALYDAEEFLGPVIEAADSLESSKIGTRAAFIILSMDSLISYERSETRIAERVAEYVRFDAEWDAKFRGKPSDLGVLFEAVNARIERLIA